MCVENEKIYVCGEPTCDNVFKHEPIWFMCVPFCCEKCLNVFVATGEIYNLHKELMAGGMVV